MSVKYQVFISSTFGDLGRERDQVIRAVLEMGHIPVGMEMFSAADDEQWGIIARQISEVDYYAVLVAHRYGSVTKEGLSYTEKEYDFAVSSGIPVLGFVLADNAPWPADRYESDEQKRGALERFRNKVKSRMVNFWTAKDDLHAKFSIALMKAFTTHPRTGWTRADEAAGPAVTKELTRLSAENASLRKKIELLDQAGKDQKEDYRREVFRILEKKKIRTNVRAVRDDWGGVINTSLLEVFDAVAPNILIENDTKNIANDVAFHITQKTEYYPHWPVPSNHLADWLADLLALDLVEPSRRRHPVSDAKEYWSLTEFGREFVKASRRLRLELATTSATELPPEAADEAAGDKLG